MSWRNQEINLEDLYNHAKGIAHHFLDNPWLAAAGIAAGSLYALRKYCTYSAGMCRCTTDLTGKIVVITGGNVGIGKATALGIAKRNAKVIIASRNSAVGKETVKDIISITGNKNVEFRKLDLSSFASVEAFAQGVKEKDGKLHILINNAGVTGTGANRMHITEDDCEHIMQCNYFGHFLLTHSLLDLLKESAPSRIINVSSMVYKWAKLDLYDLNSTKKYNPVDIYNTTKLANVLFTMEMAKRLENTGVTINVLHPGIVQTDLVKNTPPFEGLVTKILFTIVGKTPFQGAQTTLHLALAPELENVSGRYFSDCKEQKIANAAQNEHLAYQLYKTTETIVKLKKPKPGAAQPAEPGPAQPAAPEPGAAQPAKDSA